MTGGGCTRGPDYNQPPADLVIGSPKNHTDSTSMAEDCQVDSTLVETLESIVPTKKIKEFKLGPCRLFGSRDLTLVSFTRWTRGSLAP